MTVNKYAVAGGIAVVAVFAVGAGMVYCGQDFAEAVADGDFDRAECRAGLLAINDIAPAAWLTVALTVSVLGIALGLVTRQ